MKDCTYYDLLGVPHDASIEEIVNAKNFLVKKLHPDANVGVEFDTTAYMQNVLKAYRILGDPRKRKIYDRKINNSHSYDNEFEEYPMRSPNFAPYWEAANKLNELILSGDEILKQKKWGKVNLTPEKRLRLHTIASKMKPHINVLNSGGIPEKYWAPHSMNWLLFQWSQHRDFSYEMLYSMYDTYLEESKSSYEMKKIQNRSHAFAESMAQILRISES